MHLVILSSGGNLFRMHLYILSSGPPWVCERIVIMEQKLENLTILALDISGKNYLSWRLEAETYLDAHGLGDTIQAGKARYEWTHLRLEDFKSVSEYNLAMHRITSTLLLCGDTITDAEMLEKTFSTFHASNILLQQQYRAKVEVAVVDITIDDDMDENTSSHKKWQDKEKNENDGDEKEKGVTVNSCYRCGSFDHWAKPCRTPKHLVALYQKYIKNRENEMESNFVYDDRDDISDDPKHQTDETNLDDDEFLTNE
ncbi:uncharacterized protein Tco_0506356 [Tanacetum coccineum]